ncbi:MAG: hypothetical protein M3022_10540 [Actinomycetota bacterium]|nr:hypothetical protein [Actinomycetota bacterium]
MVEAPRQYETPCSLDRSVTLTQNGVNTTRERIALLEAHDRQIDTQIEQLRRDQSYLREKIAFYRARADQTSQ